MKCARCGGFSIAQYFCGGETMIEAWSYHGTRCVNCGDIREYRNHHGLSRFSAPYARVALAQKGPGTQATRSESCPSGLG